MHLIGIDDDVIDQVARHADRLGRHRAGRGHALDLGDDNAAVITRGQSLVHRAQVRAFMLVSQIAILIGRRRADDGDINRDRPEIKPFAAVELDHLNDIGIRARVHTAPGLARIDEGVETNLSEHARPPGSCFGMHVENDATGKIVGLDLVVINHLPDTGERASTMVPRGRSRQLPAAAVPPGRDDRFPRSRTYPRPRSGGSM